MIINAYSHFADDFGAYYYLSEEEGREFWIFNFGFWILDVVLDIGGVPHALGSVAAVFNGVPIFIYVNRRFRSPAVSGSLHAPAKILAASLSRGS